MHPKAAYLALNGFVLCLHKEMNLVYRIKAQQKKWERMLLRMDGGWAIAAGAGLDDYMAVSWDNMPSPEFNDLPWALIYEFCGTT